MSKQQGDSPEVVERNCGKHKKRKGNYELWMRLNPKYKTEWGSLTLDWHKFRSYNTLELAKLNLENMTRKWNSFAEKDRWEFEIREKK